MSALGNLTGDRIGERFGPRGLGMRDEGRGQGGGGRAEGLGLGGLGTRGLGTGSGYGTGRSYGTGAGRPASRVRVAAITVSGPLPREIATRVARRSLNQVRFCYERELASDASLTGHLTLRLDVGPDGGVTANQVSASTMPESVDRCVSSVGHRTRFPTASGASTVTIPYSFSSAS